MRRGVDVTVRLDARTLHRVNLAAVRAGLSRRRWMQEGLRLLAEASSLVWRGAPLLADVEDFIGTTAQLLMAPASWIKTQKGRRR